MVDKVSVAIVSYFTSEVLKESIPVIWKDPAVKEVIVIDNSCSSKEAASLRRLKTSYPFRIFFMPNVGFGRACNIGIVASKYNWVLLLNGDIIPEEGSITKLLKDALSKNADIAAPSLYMSRWDFFTPPFNAFSLKWELLLTPLFTQTPLRSIPERLYSRLFKRFLNLEAPVYTDFLPGAALLVRKGKIFFDPDFFLYFEDTDLCLRARKMGFRLVFSPSSRMLHLFSFSSKNASKHFERSYELFSRKHRSNLLRNIIGLLKRTAVKKAHPYKLDKLEKGRKYKVSSNPFFVPYTEGLIDSKLPSFIERLGENLFYKSHDS